MRVGICTIANSDWSVLSTAGEAGYDGADTWGRDLIDGVFVAADELGLEILYYGTYLRARTDDSDGYIKVKFVDQDLPYEEAIRHDAAHLRPLPLG